MLGYQSFTFLPDQFTFPLLTKLNKSQFPCKNDSHNITYRQTHMINGGNAQSTKDRLTDKTKDWMRIRHFPLIIYTDGWTDKVNYSVATIINKNSDFYCSNSTYTYNYNLKTKHWGYFLI